MSIIISLSLIIPSINDQNAKIYYLDSDDPDFIVSNKIGLQSNFFANLSNNFEFRFNNESIKLFERILINRDLNFPSNELKKGFIGLNVLTGPYYFSPIRNNSTLIARLDINNNTDYFIRTTLIITNNNLFNSFLNYYSLSKSVNNQTFIYIQNKESPNFISDNLSLQIKTNVNTHDLQLSGLKNINLPTGIQDYQDNEEFAFLPFFTSRYNDEIIMTSLDSFINFMFSLGNSNLVLRYSIFEFQYKFMFENKNLAYLERNHEQERDLLSVNSGNFINNEWNKFIINPFNLDHSISSSPISMVKIKLGDIFDSILITSQMIWIAYLFMLLGSFYFFRSSLIDITNNRKYDRLTKYLDSSGFRLMKLSQELNFILTVLVSLSFLMVEFIFIILNTSGLISIDVNMFVNVIIINSLISTGYLFINYQIFVKNSRLIIDKINFRGKILFEFKAVNVSSLILLVVVVISYIFINVAFTFYDFGIYTASPGFFDLFAFLVIGIPNLLIGIFIIFKFPKILIYILVLLIEFLKYFKNYFKKFSFFVISCLRSPKFSKVLSLDLILFCSLVFIPLYTLQFQQTILQTDNKIENGSDLNIILPFSDKKSMNLSSMEVLTYMSNYNVEISPYVLFDVFIITENRQIYPITGLALDYDSLPYIAKNEFKIYNPLRNYNNNSVFFSILRYEQIREDSQNVNLQLYFGLNTYSDNLIFDSYINNGFYLNFPKLDSSYSGSLSSMIMNLDTYLSLGDKGISNSITKETGYFIWFNDPITEIEYRAIENELTENDIDYNFSQLITGKLNDQRQIFLNNLIVLVYLLSGLALSIFFLIFVTKISLFSESITDINRGFFEQSFQSKQLKKYNFSLLTFHNVLLLLFSNMVAFGFSYAWQSILKLFLPSINSRLWEYQLVLINMENLLLNLVLLFILSVISLLKINKAISNLKGEI